MWQIQIWSHYRNIRILVMWWAPFLSFLREGNSSKELYELLWWDRFSLLAWGQARQDMPELAYSLFLLNLVLSSFILHRYCSSPDSNLYHFFFTIGYSRLIFQWLFFSIFFFSSRYLQVDYSDIWMLKYILHMVKMIKKIAALLVYYTCVYMCMCLYACVCACIWTVWWYQIH